MKRYIMLVGAFCILACFCTQPAQAVQYFESYTNFTAGSYPYGIATADFNGDTYPDLALANNAGSSISVLLGNGDGTFATSTNYDTGSSQYPYHVTVGDMDGDGVLDIICGGSMGFVIFYGVGDGTFGTANVHYFGEQVHDLVVADFDHDLDLDIATSHSVRDSVGIHINNGDSTFTHHFIATGYGTVTIETGNLDGDNWIDLLVGCSQGTVWNLKNDQAGSFIPTEVHIGILNDPASVAVTDLNGDNVDDFVVTHATNDFMFPYLNNGDGTYAVVSGYTLTDNPTNVTFHDVNHDNLQDILVCIGTTDEIELYLNQGSATFSLDSAYTCGGTPKEIVFADFDGDTYEDMAVASYTTDAACILLSRLSLVLSVEDVDTHGVLPTDFALEQNYPNPFNPDTKIRFRLPQAAHVKVEVFNLLGQLVRTLADNDLTAGIKEVTWNGTNAEGKQVVSGVYFYRIIADNFTDTKKMVLLK